MHALACLRTAPVRLSARLHGEDADAGMTTAEYAVGTSAGCGSGADKRGGRGGAPAPGNASWQVLSERCPW
jgi:hypothetical protein